MGFEVRRWWKDSIFRRSAQGEADGLEIFQAHASTGAAICSISIVPLGGSVSQRETTPLFTQWIWSSEDSRVNNGVKAD